MSETGIAGTLQADVREGKFIDFTKLARRLAGGSDPELARGRLTVSDGAVSWTEEDPLSRPEASTELPIQLWWRCFRAWLAAMKTAFPLLVGDLTAYESILIELSITYRLSDPAGFMRYDRRARQIAALLARSDAHPSAVNPRLVAWGQLDEQLAAQTFQRAMPAKCAHCASSQHWTEQHTAKLREKELTGADKDKPKRKAQDRDRDRDRDRAKDKARERPPVATAKGGGACYGFNRMHGRTACNNNDCPRPHRCWDCGLGHARGDPACKGAPKD